MAAPLPYLLIAVKANVFQRDRIEEIRYVAVNYSVTERKTTSSLFLEASNKTTRYV